MAIYQGSNAPIRIELPEPINIDSAYALLSIGTTDLKAWDKTTMQPSGLFVTLPLTEAETMAFKTGIAKLWYKISDSNKNILFTETVRISVEEWGDKRPFDIATAGTQEVEPIKIKITTDVHYEGGGGQGGTTVYVNGLPLATWNADTKQNVLSAQQLANIEAVPDKADTQDIADSITAHNTSGIAHSGLFNAIDTEISGLQDEAHTHANKAVLDQITEVPDIPTELPNPQALTFTGAVTGTYTGASALTVNIPASSTGGTTVTVDGQPVEIFNADTKQNVLSSAQLNNIAEIPSIKETAESAIQTETDPTVPDWVRNKPNKPTYTAAEVGALTKVQGDSYYEPKRATDGTAYNADYGTAEGTVVEGNRVLTPVPSGAQFTDTVNTDVTVGGTKVATFNADTKQDKLVSGTNIKTINGEAVLGSGDITIESGGGTITDIKVANTSLPIVEGVVNIPTASASAFGVVKIWLDGTILNITTENV